MWQKAMMMNDYDDMMNSYASDNHKAGLAACERMDVPGHPYEGLARANKLFYVPTLAQLVGSPLQYSRLSASVRDKWSEFNPSVVTVGDRLICNIRSSNYEYSAQGYKWVDGVPDLIQTDNYIGQLFPFSDGWQFCPRQYHRSPDEADGSAILGTEDMRLYTHDGQLCASATMCLDRYMIRQIVEVPLAKIELAPVHPYAPSSHRVRYADSVLQPQRVLNIIANRDEKNWMPIVSGSESRLQGWVYQWWPYPVLLDPNGTIVHIGPESRPLCRHFRGGSQLLSVADTHLAGLVHEVSFYQDSGHRVYTHRLVTIHTKTLEVAYSPPFHFGPTSAGHPSGPEYCAGFAHYRDKYIMSFGYNDASAWVVTLTEADFDRLLSVTT